MEWIEWREAYGWSREDKVLHMVCRMTAEDATEFMLERWAGYTSNEEALEAFISYHKAARKEYL